MGNNPFTLMFGKEPNLTIHREDILSEISSDFSSKVSNSQMYIMIGARGAGKTVLLSELYDSFDKEDDWICVDVNPHRNILEDLASSLYEKGKMKHLFLKGSFDISFHGISFSLEGKEPVTSISSVVEKMLTYLKKHGKKVLITLDEVTPSEKIKEFSHDFQSYVRKDYPIYLLMTGLYENVMSLQNDKSLTFLYRAPKILLKPLDRSAIKNSYKKALNVDDETACELAKLSKGYGFGYQLLGHLFFEHKKIDDDLLLEYDQKLRINAYDKILSSVSESELKMLRSLIGVEKKKTSDILIETGFNNKNYSVFRERLINKGVIISPANGYVSLALPRFAEFLKEQDQ